MNKLEKLKLKHLRTLEISRAYVKWQLEQFDKNPEFIPTGVFSEEFEKFKDNYRSSDTENKS